MHTLFLLTRIALGGFFAYEGARYLTPYGRSFVMAAGRFGGAKGSPFIAVAGGLMMLFGGLSIVMGVAPVLGIATIVVVLAFTSVLRGEPVRLRRDMTLAVLLLLLLLVPQPWPMRLVS